VLEVVQKCLPHLLASAEGRARMKAMIPTYDVDIKNPANADYFKAQSRRAFELLQLS
jgi:malate dehydrogenase (quinone)